MRMWSSSVAHTQLLLQVIIGIGWVNIERSPDSFWLRWLHFHVI